MSWRRMASAAADTMVRALGERDANDDVSLAYVVSGQAPVPLLGIFLDAHAEADLDSTTGVSTVAPVVDFKIADLPEYPPAKTSRITISRVQGDPEAIGTQTFRIVDHQPDGEGMVTFVLVLA